MPLSPEEIETVARLSHVIRENAHKHERLDAYYEGVNRLERLGIAVPPELGMFVTAVNWPRVTADAIEQRCDVEGFRIGGTDDADDELWQLWQDNDLDEVSQLAHLDAIVLGRSYVCVGARDDTDDPLITAESVLEMAHDTDPRTRRVTAALRLASPTTATLYLPDATVWLQHRGSTGWTETDRDAHDLGVTPVVPLINRPRLRGHTGASELVDVITLTDAAARALTNAQVATEVLAVPQRFVLGAQPKDFVDQQGNPLTAWETYFGSVWALVSADAKVGQFTAADLGNFERIVNHYAQLVASVSGLPARFYGQHTVNPPSEGSIVADETRLIKNAYRKHRAFGGAWERVMRLARRITDGEWNPDLNRLETLWANPETPTRAQTADAVVKLVAAGVLPVEAAWEELGYSATRRVALARMRAEQQAADPLSAAAEVFRQPTQPGEEIETPGAAPAPGAPRGSALDAEV